MAISRHKVLSEMQQQLEMASSKCGNLQKQLEIVKNKVRQSSTTNLLYREPPENKENKVKTDDGHISEAEREKEYEKALSISSTSTEDANEQRDVNIIKVFYDRLGQMDYPKGQVELSDISSEENELDIDQLLSSVNFPVNKDEKAKRKEKRNDKKAKEWPNKTIASAPKRKTPKGPPKTISPYESPFMRPVKQMPVKKKNQKNLQKSIKVGSDNYSTTSNRGAVKPKSQQGHAFKMENDNAKKRKAHNAYVGMPTKNGAAKAFQEPIKRVMKLANELRKTKSSTVAERKDAFPDSRSLTRLNSKAIPEVESTNPEEMANKSAPPKESVDGSDALGQGLMDTVKPDGIPKDKRVMNTNLGRGALRAVKNDAAKPKKEEEPLPKKPAAALMKLMQDKETSLSDLASSRTNGMRKPDPPAVTKSKYLGLRSAFIAKPIDTDKSPGKWLKSKHFEPKTKPPQRAAVGQPNQSWTNRKKPVVTGEEGVPKLPMNGMVSRQAETNTKVSSELKKRVDMFEKATTLEATKDAIEDQKKGVEKKVTSAKMITPTLVRANSSTMFDGSFRRGPPSMASSVPQTQTLRTDYNEKELNDLNPLTISQIKRMKDNFMKFNSIPFIVGQSTTKSYHIGLNLQETYSLFKQTPSMTALMVSKYADADHHSNARSTRTGYTGRSTISAKARESCPACDPVPEPSPEQKADPWAVPQDEAPVLRVCTCFPKRMVSFEQVLNQLYFTNMNLVKLHPSFLPSKDGINEENEEIEGKDKPSLPHKPTNTLYYTKLLRSIQNLKDNIMG